MIPKVVNKLNIFFQGELYIEILRTMELKELGIFRAPLA